MTVEVLRLTGLRGSGADDEARELLADHGTHPDLSRLLVIDDTVALIGHSAVYERLLTSRRLDHLLCVAVGPRAEGSRELRFPGSISGGQGSIVLWVGDPRGVDWRLMGSTIALGHSGNSASGLHHLVDLLSVDEVFDRVCEIGKKVPGGVASPGLRLAGADDEGASFAAALATAIRRLTGPGLSRASLDSEPFTALQEARPGTAGLGVDGELSRYRENVGESVAVASDALKQLASITGMLGLNQPSIHADVIEVGSGLGAFRDRVIRLLKDAHAPGGLSETQRSQLRAAGVRLPDQPPREATSAPGSGHGAGTDSGRSLVNRAIAEAVRSGETLPRVSKRLSLTASAMDHGGSASYLPQVDQACPPTLVRRLADPPSPPRPWRWWLPTAVVLGAVLGVLASRWNLAAGVIAGVLGLTVVMVIAVVSWRGRVRTWNGQLALHEAIGSADALADLITRVAAKEWSSGRVTPNEITLARIALDGASEQLIAHADDVGDAGSGVRASRLSESLMPTLRDLVLAVLTARSVTASASGRDAVERARGKTAELVSNWTQYARDEGALARPSFAASTASDTAYAEAGEVSEISEAIQHDPRGVMWQLCTAADLGSLDPAGHPQVVAFAPRLTKQPLVDVLPPETVWTSSGAQAGLLRLIPLRSGLASPSWEAEQRSDPSQ